MSPHSRRKRSHDQIPTNLEQDKALAPLRKRRSTRLARDPAKRSNLDGNDKSLFLDLPAELRELIYTFVAQSAHALLRPEPRGKLLDHSTLLRVSHQCKDEYTQVLYHEAPVVVAEVVDFDFSHIVSAPKQITYYQWWNIRSTLTI